MKGGALELGGQVAKSSVKRGASVVDFFLRLIAVAVTLGSAIAMGTTNETLSFATQFVRFRAKYNDLPMFTFFVVANSVVAAYLILSLALSIFNIMRSRAQGSRVILMFFDAGMMALLTAGASAATAIVYLAHKGNSRANWFAVCQQYNSFCERISGALIGSYGGVLILIVLILLSAVTLSRR